MTELHVRRLLVDLTSPIAARWNGGDAFRSAYFNALSMSFPVGEQFFIDSVRNGLKTLPEADRAAYAQEVAGFIGQEATHRRVHALFNGHLQKLGFTNWVERHAAKRIAAQAHLDVRMHVAGTAATEHLTAIFANWTMRHPEAFEGTEERLKTLWLWHAAEESEHRSTAFDLYHAIGGNHTWRVRVFKYSTFIFFADIGRQTLLNLWHDRALFKPGTWVSAWKLLFSPNGMVRGNYRLWKDYMKPTFHPSQEPADTARQWLLNNPQAFALVNTAAWDCGFAVDKLTQSPFAL